MSDERIEELVQLINDGYSYSEAGKEVGMSSKSNVSHALKRHGYNRNSMCSLDYPAKPMIVSITEDELEKAGFETEGEVYYRKKVEGDRIVIEKCSERMEKIEGGGSQ